MSRIREARRSSTAVACEVGGVRVLLTMGMPLLCKSYTAFSLRAQHGQQRGVSPGGSFCRLGKNGLYIYAGFADYPYATRGHRFGDQPGEGESKRLPPFAQVSGGSQKQRKRIAAGRAAGNFVTC